MVNCELSPYLIAVAVAWLGAHIIKYAIGSFNKEKPKLRFYIFMSGGMPSSHTATVSAMATVIGMRDGVGSGLFGLAVLFALIVMYDAMKVRRSSGEQGEAIKSLIKTSSSDIKEPRVSKGHTPVEVFFGLVFGIIIGTVVFLSTI